LSPSLSVKSPPLIRICPPPFTVVPPLDVNDPTVSVEPPMLSVPAVTVIVALLGICSLADQTAVAPVFTTRFPPMELMPLLLLNVTVPALTVIAPVKVLVAVPSSKSADTPVLVNPHV